MLTQSIGSFELFLILFDFVQIDQESTDFIFHFFFSLFKGFELILLLFVSHECIVFTVFYLLLNLIIT